MTKSERCCFADLFALLKIHFHTEIDMTCPDGSKISILKGYANNKDFLKKQCSSFWPDDDCECTTPKYPLAMHAFARFIVSSYFY